MDQLSSAGRGMNMVGDEECLSDRKWWCFLLSSIFTFLMGIFSVLVVRAFASLFCRKVSPTHYVVNCDNPYQLFILFKVRLGHSDFNINFV